LRLRLDRAGRLGSSADSNIEHEVHHKMSQHTKTSKSSWVTEWDVVWPPEFKHPRNFDAKTENRPHVEDLDEVECGSRSGDEPEDSADELSEASGGDDETTAEDRGDDEQASLVIDDQEPQSAVRRLGVVVSSEGELSHVHPKEIEEIVEFIENRTAKNSAAPSPPVALIIDQIGESGQTPEMTGHQHRRADHGGITRDKLLARLQIPVSFY
jgi:hypothetical protein